MSKIDVLIPEKKKPSNLTDFLGDALNRISNEEMPWQTGRNVRMPVASNGKPISNINYLLLVDKGDDHRWGYFRDYANLGAHIKKGEHATFGVHWRQFNKPTAEEIAEQESGKPVTSKQKVSVRKPVAVPYFNRAQSSLEPEALPGIDLNNAMMQIEDIAMNAGLSFSDEPMELAYDGDVVYANVNEVTPEAIGKAVFGLVDWSMDDRNKLASNQDESPKARQMMVRAIAGSMLCSEFGVPVPNDVMQTMAFTKTEALAYFGEHKDELFKACKQASDLRQFVLQYSPSNEAEQALLAEAEVDESENNLTPKPQPNSLFGA